MVYTWNEFLFASVLVSNPKIKTLTIGIMNLQGQYTTNYVQIFAGSAISMIPIFIIYLIFQEQISKGMTAGAVKG